MAPTPESVASSNVDPPVRGFLHRPASPSGDGLVLTHGAGGNARMALLFALAEAFAGAGFTVLRCDLPFRQARPFGPPRPSEAARDREGLRNAVGAMRKLVSKRVFLGGQSYGGRQASMLLAEEYSRLKATAVVGEGVDVSDASASLQQKQVPPLRRRICESKSSDLGRNDDVLKVDVLVDGLLLLSYPLHPPARPDQLRTQHLPELSVPTLFVQGTKDPFGTIEEIESARKLIPAWTEILPVEGAGHDLGFAGKKRREDLPSSVLAKFSEFFES